MNSKTATLTLPQGSTEDHILPDSQFTRALRRTLKTIKLNNEKKDMPVAEFGSAF